MPLQYFGEDEEYIKAECKNCDRVLRIKKIFLNRSEIGYSINPPGITCICGSPYTSINGYNENPVYIKTGKQKNPEVRCPKCGAKQITTSTKGFGLGRAATGALLLGPVGLLGGFIGSTKVKLVCLNCGKQWYAGK